MRWRLGRGVRLRALSKRTRGEEKGDQSNKRLHVHFPFAFSPISTIRRMASGRLGSSSVALARVLSAWRARQSCEMPGFVNQEEVVRIVEVFSREILSGELELNFIVADG